MVFKHIQRRFKIVFEVNVIESLNFTFGDDFQKIVLEKYIILK